MMKREMCILLICIAAISTGCQFTSNIPTGRLNNQIMQPKDMKVDLDYLFKTIEQVHPNMYAYTTKAEFDKKRNELYRQIKEPMSKTEFYKKAEPVVTLLEDGHMWIWDETSNLPGEDRYWPLICKWQKDELVVHHNAGDSDIKTGVVILSINGEKANAVMNRLSKYRPNEAVHGNIYWATEDISQLLKLEYGPVENFDVEVKNEDGNSQRYAIKTVSLNKIREQNVRSSPLKGEYKFTIFEKRSTAYLVINSFSINVKEYENLVFQELKEKQIKNLIIDLRNNGGGNSDEGEILLKYITNKAFRQFEKVDIKISVQADNLDFIKELPKKKLHVGSVASFPVELKQENNPLRFDGKIYLLAGRETYSAANSFVSAIKCFKIGTIIGEETGGKTACFGNTYSFKMPNSRFTFQVSGKYFVEACGKPDGKGVIPDFEVLQNPKDSEKGIDTVLEFTLNMIEKEI